jgi:hypothetical protein
MKYGLTIAVAALMGAATAAFAAGPAASGTTTVACVPGMAATAPDTCELPGFHWKSTTVYFGNHADARTEWMLLPDGPRPGGA